MGVGGVSIAPARRFVPGHAQPVSSSHTAFRLSFTPGRGGRLRFVSSVPSPGIAGLIASGQAAGEEAAARCGLSCLPMCAGFSVARKSWAAARNRSIPGQPTVSTNAKAWSRRIL